jgi:transposase
MPRPRTAMRKIREVLRLRYAEGLTPRQIRSALGLPRVTIQRHLQRAAERGLSWPLPDDIDDRALEEALFARVDPTTSQTRPVPEWPTVHRELRRKGVTLQLLWQEYKEQRPDGFQYTWFSTHYRQYERRLDLVMRNDHLAGEKLFVDFPGQTVPIYDPATEAEVMRAEIFVAVLGASNYTYVEALPSQELPHWIRAHVNAFNFFGSCPRVLVPDNLKSAITKAHRYEPVVNESYADMAAHFGAVVIPARPRRPRDKAKVELGCLLVERWILARLRNHHFYSLADLNAEIRRLLVQLNQKPFKKMPGSRRSWFEEIERPALRPLPATPYEFALFSKAKVHIDYHVQVDYHYYSVPHQLVGETVDVRLTVSTVEVLHRGRRVTSHLRSFRRGGHTTKPEHMPRSHQEAKWPPHRLLNWAAQTGPHTAAMFKGVMESRPHPEQGYRTCLGIHRLGKRYGAQRLEAACQRALSVRALSLHSVESILRNGLDRQQLTDHPRDVRPRRQHENLRGPDHYS